MNFFSSEAFLGALAAAYYPQAPCRAASVDVDGREFRVLVVGRARVVHEARFLDYLEPVPSSGGRGRLARAGFLRRVRHRVGPIDDVAAALPPGSQLAPLVRWSAFSSFDDFIAFVEARSKSAFKTTARKARKLAREVGALRFVQRTGDERVLLRLFAWKSEQYKKSGLPDMLASPRTRALFRHLVRLGAVELSALYAGERLVAAHLGPRCDGRFYHWLPAYDPDEKLRACSPGNVLNHELMRRSHAAGDHTFDLLLGDEPYKRRYATHAAVVGPLGDAPVHERAWARLRDVARAPVRRVPLLESALRSAKRRLVERELL